MNTLSSNKSSALELGRVNPFSGGLVALGFGVVTTFVVGRVDVVAVVVAVGFRTGNSGVLSVLLGSVALALVGEVK